VARIVDTKEIPLGQLIIGKGQIRLQGVGAGIKELAQSIEAKGLLQPIVVAAVEGGKYEILLGQRRFLAHQELKLPTIRAQILDEVIDETEAKVLSLTENMMRRDISRKDKIDVCTVLYKRYGSMKDVAEATGLPQREVSQFVKYDRLKPELKALVDSSEVGLDVALKAEDAASATGYVAEEAIMLAKELEPMSGAARQQLVKAAQEASDRPMDEVIELSKEQAMVTQVVVTLGRQAHAALQEVASQEGTTQDDAAGELLTDALRTRGYAI
jgi:ParB family transcriptional regulator, chromosome partitioning protein